MENCNRKCDSECIKLTSFLYFCSWRTFHRRWWSYQFCHSKSANFHHQIWHEQARRFCRRAKWNWLRQLKISNGPNSWKDFGRVWEWTVDFRKIMQRYIFLSHSYWNSKKRSQKVYLEQILKMANDACFDFSICCKSSNRHASFCSNRRLCFSLNFNFCKNKNPLKIKWQISS